MHKKIQEMIKKMKLTHNDVEVAKCRKYLEKAKGNLESAVEMRRKDDLK
jgi:translation elongation factor EF-Ts